MSEIPEQIRTVDGADGYPLHYRHWRPAAATSQILLFHGVVSHSEWLSPVASRLASAGIDVVCPDRRGTGLNTRAPGDTPDVKTLLADAECVRRATALEDVPVHIAGFCWGATYAIACLERARDSYESLIMIAPSVFPAADVGGADLVTGESGEASLTPNVPLDRFTSGPAYADYIIPDPLKTTAVSPRFNSALVAMNRFLGARWAKLVQPTLMILASHDRLSDNAKHDKAFAALRASRKKKVLLEGEHGLQFDAPESTATTIAQWVGTTTC